MGVLGSFAGFTEESLSQSLFFNKFEDHRPSGRFWHGCFPMAFAKFLGVSLLRNNSRLLLQSVYFFKKFQKLIEKVSSMICKVKGKNIIKYNLYITCI